MNYRHGTCQSCKAQYKVPASFQADRAKCKSCGGVVQIGPVDGAAPAQRSTPAARQVPAKPVPARPLAAAPKPAAPAAAKPAQTDSVRAAAESTAERVRNAGRKQSADATTRKSSSEADSKSSSRSSRRSPTPKKKKSSAPMLAAVLVLVVAGGGGGWYLTRGGDAGPKAAEKLPGDGVPLANAEDVLTDEALASEAAAAEAAALAAAEAELAAAEETPAEASAKAEPNPDEIDLTVFVDEEQLPGTSDEDWATIQGWVTEFMDPNAGAAGNRAKAKLAARGRESFPAIVNAFKRVDFSTEEGYRTGDLTQRLLMQICNGQNFDWSYGFEPKNVVFNKKVVRFWIISWQQAREAPAAWAKLSKTTPEEAQKLFAITGPFDAAGAEAPAEAAASKALDDF